MARVAHTVAHFITGTPADPSVPNGAKAALLKRGAQEGGFTVRADGGPDPTEGYAVGHKGTTGITPTAGIVQPNGRVSASSINDFTNWSNRHRGSIAAAGHMGAWNNAETGNMVFNATEVAPERAAAITMGSPQFHDQISTWDIGKAQEIGTGGKGDEERNY